MQFYMNFQADDIGFQKHFINDSYTMIIFLKYNGKQRIISFFLKSCLKRIIKHAQSIFFKLKKKYLAILMDCYCFFLNYYYKPYIIWTSHILRKFSTFALNYKKDHYFSIQMLERYISLMCFINYTRDQITHQ